MSTLPLRPWVRGDVAFAWRDDRSLQIGDPPRQVIIDRADRDVVSWLLSLQGDRTLAEALDVAERDGLPRRRALSLLRRALPTGLVDDSDEVPESFRTATPQLRQRLAGELAAARLARGSAREASAAFDRRMRGIVAIHGDNALADAVAAALSAAGVLEIVRESRLSSSSRRSRRAAGQRSCHVLCDAPHPECSADPDAMALDVPHLPVTAFGARAIVGPLVLPGLTGCLRCLDLHRADRDPAWPRVAVQLHHRRTGTSSCDATLVMLAAASAAAQVLAWLDDHVDDAGPLRWPRGWPDAAPPTVSGRLTFASPGATISREECPPHPLCGCLWTPRGR